MPFIPGNIRSSSTRSGRSSRTAVSACVPSPMTAVSKPSPRSTMVSISASEGSSSTTRILCLMVSMVSPESDKPRIPHREFSVSTTPKWQLAPPRATAPAPNRTSAGAPHLSLARGRLDDVALLADRLDYLIADLSHAGHHRVSFECFCSRGGPACDDPSERAAFDQGVGCGLHLWVVPGGALVVRQCEHELLA